MTVRVIVGVYKGEMVIDDIDSDIKCPNCDQKAGEEMTDHPGAFECVACGYFWTDAPRNADMMDWREDR